MFLTLRKDTQKVSVSGVMQPEADLMARTEEYLAIKVPGYSYKYGVLKSDRSYAPAEIQFWKISEEEDLGQINRIVAERVLDFHVQSARKRSK